jgi:CheY-specific phosphatase CheX
VKNILVLSGDKTWKMGLAKALKDQFKQNEIQAQHVASRSEAITEISQTQFDLFLIGTAVKKNEIEMIFRYITTNENFNMNIFFISEDFEQFSEILKLTKFPKIHLFSAPIEFSEILKQLRMTLIPIEKPQETDKKLKLNLEFLKTFVESSKYIFEEFCLLKDIQHQKPMLLSEKNRKDYDLEGYIELESDLFSGMFYVCFDKPTYLKVVEHVLMEQADDINPGNVDFVAEIVNMIYGQSKIALNQSGHNFKKVIPQFTVNPMPHETTNIVTVVPIDTSIGTIDIKIELIKYA